MSAALRDHNVGEGDAMIWDGRGGNDEVKTELKGVTAEVSRLG